MGDSSYLIKAQTVWIGYYRLSTTEIIESIEVTIRSDLSKFELF